MSVSSLLDCIALAIARSGYGFSSYDFEDIDDTSIRLTITLLSALNPFRNLDQVVEIKNRLNYLLNERNYKIYTLDDQQTDDTITLHITLKPFGGKILRAVKTVTFWYDQTE